MAKGSASDETAPAAPDEGIKEVWKRRSDQPASAETAEPDADAEEATETNRG